MTAVRDGLAGELLALLSDRAFDADKINRFAGLCGEIRATASLEERLALAERLRRDAPSGDTIRLHSVLFQLTGDLYHFERILHYLLLGRDSVGPELMHYVYWCISRQLFMGAAAPEKAAAFPSCDLYRFYEELVRAVMRRWRVVPPRAVPRGGPVRRVAVVTNQFLGDQHQPSRDCFDYAARLREEQGVEAVIFNANTMPARVECLFIPPFVATAIPEYQGVHTVSMFGQQLRMASFTEPALTAGKLADIVAAVDGYDPDLIVSFGGSNIVCDLFAEADARPVVCLPTTSGVTISLAQLVLGYDEQDYTRSIPELYRAPFAGRFRPFALGFTPPPTAEAAGDFGLGKAGFVFAVVGNRLDQEVGEEFLELSDEILDRCPEAVIAFAGEVETLPARLEARRNRARLRSLGRIPDIRAFYRRCHAYLNPRRQGGGGSAAFALAEGLPVVTLAQGDVAGVAGPEIGVPDRAAFLERAGTLVRDPAERERQAALSRHRFGTVGDRRRCVERLLAYGEEARALWRSGTRP
ncbi:glycosyltransferase [Azospirillum sp. SYSU D00513]|uniref:glycosyltransferase n=1 Tax=Azospirillum sp. SYSU D00513 TaxID=2812561 RepID=UPI001A97BE62|nr:glycosyltransferase [Azospirillum sp. SYSU D00513]